MNAKAAASILPFSGGLALIASVLFGTRRSARRAGQAFNERDAERLLALGNDWMEENGLKLTVVYRGVRDSAPSEGQGNQLMLCQSGRGPDQIRQLLAWASRECKRLSGTGAEGVWYVNVQGWLKDGLSAQSLWRELGGMYRAVDRYEDAGSRSAAYVAEAFGTSMNVGGQQVQLQAAAHQDTESKRTRVTFGTPLILIEY